MSKGMTTILHSRFT